MRQRAQASGPRRSRAAWRGGRGGANVPQVAGGVEAVLIVARIDRLGDLAFHLHPDVIGEHRLCARAAQRFGIGQRGRQAGAVGCVSRP